MARVMAKVANIRRGDPLDTETMIGAQASRQQFDKILSYIDIARKEGGKSSRGRTGNYDTCAGCRFLHPADID